MLCGSVLNPPNSIQFGECGSSMLRLEFDIFELLHKHWKFVKFEIGEVFFPPFGG